MKKEKIYLSNKSKRLIMSTLKIKKLEDALYLDFPDKDDKFDYDRKDIDVFSKLYTGSIRLSNGLFYTTKREYDEHINRLLSIQLP